jgi:hypothetical protein
MMFRGLLLALVLSLLVGLVASAEENLYKTLGVTKSSSTKEIKQAYRRKARDTHPDKNKGVPEEEAAEAFRKVVHAFEILSDDASRKYYDRTGRSSSPENTGGGGGYGGNAYGGQRSYGGGGGSFHFTWNFNRKPLKLKDQFKVQQAMSRVLSIVSMDQLRTIMLDDDDLLERNLVICFSTPGEMDKWVDDEMVFPYPFAHMSSQGIWWEDLLQTAKIRYMRENEITRHFGIPAQQADFAKAKPIFLFGKKGQPLEPENMARLSTKDRNEFETFVWKELEVHMEFINLHEHPVEIYWIHGSRAHKKIEKLEANSRVSHSSMLAHEWYVRDLRVDSRHDSPNRSKLTKESSLDSWKIGVDFHNVEIRADGVYEITIKNKDCMDLSGHCNFWKYQGECKNNAVFMKQDCPLTCNHCKPGENERDEL